MSCRHDLALGTCKRCYPKTGTIEPGPEEDYEPNLEGPGAIPAPPAATMPNIKKRITTVTVTEEHTISASAIREAFKLPPHAKVLFHVPGGGDWSNEDIEIDDRNDQLHVVVETTSIREE